MIKINLASKKASAIASGGGGAGLLAKFGGGSGALQNLTPEKKAMIVTGVLYGGVVLGANHFIEGYKTQELEKVQSEIAAIESKIKLADSELSKTTGFEKLKKDLENDEKLIRTKIETIQSLINERTTPPKILIALSQATPKDVWIQNFSLKENKLSLSGRAYGIALVSDFMRSLEETIYFKDVVLKSSRQAKEQGQELATFELEANRK